MRTALAPADLAFWAFWVKKHVPRLKSATAPRGKAAKSEGSQPLVAESGSTGATWPVTVPLPE
jgi:hypothetical protein